MSSGLGAHQPPSWSVVARNTDCQVVLKEDVHEWGGQEPKWAHSVLSFVWLQSLGTGVWDTYNIKKVGISFEPGYMPNSISPPAKVMLIKPQQGELSGRSLCERQAQKP